MLSLWRSLTWPQGIALGLTLFAVGLGALPTLFECITHLIETLVALAMCAVGAKWPAFEKRVRELMRELRRQRLQIQKMRRRHKKHPMREGVAA